MSTENDEHKTRFTNTGGYIDAFKYREVMKAVAKTLNANFRIFRTGGSALERHHMEIPYKDWMIHLHVSDTRPLRIEMEFKTKQDFDLTISEEDFIERIIKRIRNRDIETGWRMFDTKYLVKSNKPGLTKSLLTHEFQYEILHHNLHSISIQTNERKMKGNLICVIQRYPAGYDETLELIALTKTFVDMLQSLHIIY